MESLLRQGAGRRREEPAEVRNGNAISSRYKPAAPASEFRACSQVIHLLALRACIQNWEVIALPFLSRTRLEPKTEYGLSSRRSLLR